MLESQWVWSTLRPEPDRPGRGSGSPVETVPRNSRTNDRAGPARPGNDREASRETNAKRERSSVSYDASSIEVLEGLDPVRKRPAMYIGTTGPDGLHHLVYEVVDNSDGRSGGRSLQARSTSPSRQDNSVTVVGRWTRHPGGRCTRWRSGSASRGGADHPARRRQVQTTNSYKVSGGLHGVGVSVVNALSSQARSSRSSRDGKVWRQTYARGEPTSKFEIDRRPPRRRAPGSPSMPDGEIFSDARVLLRRPLDSACASCPS